MSKLVLPKIAYGPMCMRILKEFVAHHEIAGEIDYPDNKDKMEDALSKIFDIILLSMGEKKREDLIVESVAYFRDLPPSLR